MNLGDLVEFRDNNGATFRGTLLSIKNGFSIIMYGLGRYKIANDKIKLIHSRVKKKNDRRS